MSGAIFNKKDTKSLDHCNHGGHNLKNRDKLTKATKTLKYFYGKWSRGFVLLKDCYEWF